TTAAPIFGKILTELLVDYAAAPSDQTAAAQTGAPSRGTELAAVAHPAVPPVPTAPADTRPEIEIVEASYRNGGVVVPDLTGLGLRAAVQKGSECGLIIEADGSGRVGRQSPAPGAVVPPGTIM